MGVLYFSLVFPCHCFWKKKIKLPFPQIHVKYCFIPELVSGLWGTSFEMFLWCHLDSRPQGLDFVLPDAASATSFYCFLHPWSLFLEHFGFLMFFPFFFQELHWWKHFPAFILLWKSVLSPLEWHHYLMHIKHSGRSLDWCICSRCKQRFSLSILYFCFSHKLNNLLNLSLNAVFKHTK